MQEWRETMQSNNIRPDEQDEGGTSWPVIDGSYRVGDPIAPIAVCALTSDELINPLAQMPGVAIAGEVQTANLLEGTVAEPSEKEPFGLFHRTKHVLQVHWGPETQVIMGEPSQVGPGALLRVRGRRRTENEVDAERLVILTNAARMQEESAES
jgi:hypothetical protein